MTKPIEHEPIFQDRQEAGQALAQRLRSYRDGKRLLILALSPGGAVVGAEVAKSLGAPMELFRSRRLPVPGNPALSFGSMTEEGTICLLSEIISRYEIPDEEIQEAISSKRKEILQRRHQFRKMSMGFNIQGRKVILIDEGVSNGTALFSALDWLRLEGADARIVAIPVAGRQNISRMKASMDEVVVLHTIPSYRSIKSCYQQFDPVPEAAVRTLLEEVNRGLKAA
ncbi:MAG: hypothetical protein HY282_14625 [Nitrospirae bacterium]|nr:hypothetical protein [Candidatus Manganitrophaceae bacterium]